MNVGSVNSVAFTAKTKDGNDYKKTHMGLKSGLVVGASVAPIFSLIGSISEGASFKKGIVEAFKDITTDLFKGSKKEGWVIIGAAAAITGVTAGIGAIYDAIGNKKMAKNVDNAVAKATEQ